MFTILANIRHSIRNREPVTIGGGEFSPDELRQFLNDIDFIYSLTIRPKKFIGKYVITTKSGLVVYSGDNWAKADTMQDMRKGRIFWEYDYKKECYILENFTESKKEWQ